MTVTVSQTRTGLWLVKSEAEWSWCAPREVAEDVARKLKKRKPKKKRCLVS